MCPKMFEIKTIRNKQNLSRIISKLTGNPGKPLGPLGPGKPGTPFSPGTPGTPFKPGAPLRPRSPITDGQQNTVIF